MKEALKVSTAILFIGGLIACYTMSIANTSKAPVFGCVTPTGSMSTARAAHTATLLPNGKVLIAGGMESEAICLATAELYDPVTGTFTKTGNMTTKRIGHRAVL